MASPEDEKATLNKWIKEKNDPMYKYTVRSLLLMRSILLVNLRIWVIMP